MTDEQTVGLAKFHLSVAYKTGGNSDVTAKYYSQWAKNDYYEKHLNPELYAGPSIAAQAVADYFSTSKKENVKILDVAAGTGFVAEFLLSHGFSRIDALDPSEGMLQKARVKNIYNHLICCYLDDNKLPVLKDSYDCAVTSGGMGEGHIPYTGLDQLIRVVAPGGLICIVMREEYLNHSQYKDKLEPHMEELVQEKKWELVSKTVVPNYCFDLNGLVYKFKVLDGKYTTNEDD